MPDTSNPFSLQVNPGDVIGNHGVPNMKIGTAYKGISATSAALYPYTNAPDTMDDNQLTIVKNRIKKVKGTNGRVEAIGAYILGVNKKTGGKFSLCMYRVYQRKLIVIQRVNTQVYNILPIDHTK
jgi:PPE-repeat protein